MPQDKSKSRPKPYIRAPRLRRFLSLESICETESVEVSESNSEISEIMATANTANTANNNVVAAADLFNSLRVPDAIKDLPKFSGNPRLLYEFINNVEEIRALISCTEGTAYGKMLLRAIRNKIEGPANEVLNMYGTPLDWSEIKKNLTLHYSDKRSESATFTAFDKTIKRWKDFTAK